MATEGEGCFMSKNEMHCYETIEEFLNGKLTRKETALLLEISERAVSRRAVRVKQLGFIGAKHGNSLKPSKNKTPSTLKREVMQLMEQTYFDHNITHTLEMLKTNHGIHISYSTLRSWAHEGGIVKRRKATRRVRRDYRERLPSPGMMLQMDGSHHAWNGKDKWVLIAAIDDATSSIPWAEFFNTEDTLNCMTVLQRIIEHVGIPRTIYVDKAGWFGGSAKRSDFAQFTRACDELGIKVIFANSPQAKGRIERTWDTFQDRLCPELRLGRITTIPKANEHLRTVFLPQYWEVRNTVVARQPISQYRPLPVHTNLREIFCLKERRTIKNDQTFSHDGKIYRVVTDFGASLKGQCVEFRTYQDMKQKVFFANRPVEIKEVDKPLRYVPELHGKRKA